eukprot:symbB.v1.2.004640.t1/scaffold265.1/size247395/3
MVNLGFILAEFVFLHYHTIATLWFSMNPREEKISLAADWELCSYYLVGMLYILMCMLQIKHGLPALGGDGLRPKAAALFSAANLYTEKVYYYLFMVHYNIPFVDDIRVIVDWTVVPTSLDLWMYWKVEDAHTAFYRTRHLMFVRGQSYYAEQRDMLEKCYNGWVILFAVVLVILMPIIVFSPFSPFPNTVLVEQANLVLGMTVASSCFGADQSQLCRYVELQLFNAPAIQIQRSNSSQKAQYLQDNPRVNTDIDIQDIQWPWFSKARGTTAQQAFGKKFLRLFTAKNRVLVNFQQTLEEAEIKDGECLAALVLQPHLAATKGAFALWCQGHSAIAVWGHAEYGGDSSAVRDQLKGVQQIQAAGSAFSAILEDGSVITWGDAAGGGDSSAVQDQLRGVQQIQAAYGAFAAILEDGSVVTWGNARCGGDSSAVRDQLKGVQQIQSTPYAFAAILEDGSVVTWGDAHTGGDSSSVQHQLKGVQQIQATNVAFAAILEDGSVVTWGNAGSGGNSSAVQDQLRGVQQIQPARNAFAAILEDGSVVTWGNAAFGGDSSAVQGQLRGVQQIQGANRAFAAIPEDGSVVSWGDAGYGAGDSSAVQHQLRGVQQIQATLQAFAAILADGSVVTWGNPHFGGDSSAVQDQLKNVQQIQASGNAFAAILEDGSLVLCANEVLKMEKESKAIAELKGAVDSASVLGLRSRKVALAKQLLAEQCATDLEELESAMKLGSPKKLHGVLQELLDRNELAAEDLKRGSECLKTLQEGQKALEEALESPGIDALKKALQMAEEAKLQGVTREEAEKKLQEMEANSELEEALQEADRIEAQPNIELPGANCEFPGGYPPFVQAEEWPAAVEVTSFPDGDNQNSAPSAAGYPSFSRPSSSSSADKAAPGLRRFIAELSSQLAEEVKRREQEEEELERRASEKRRLLEDLDLVRKQKEKLDFEQRADEAAAEEIEQQHSKLAEEHQALRQEVAKQETQLQQLREEAKARTGQGRDWARDGPEKDALVETKLRIAEAHDELAQLRQQLWLNREGLKQKLAELQAENMRLRTGRSPLQWENLCAW